MLQNLCRVCLVDLKEPQIPISTILEDNKSVLDTLIDISSIEVVSDEFPKSICEKCFEITKMCNNFRQKIIKSDQYLKANIKLTSTENFLIKQEDSDFKKEFDNDDDEEEEDDDDDDDVDNIVNEYLEPECDIKEQPVIEDEYTDKKPGKTKRPIKKQEAKKLFECQTCLKMFKKKSMLIQHTNKVHFGEKKHICPVCNKRFAWKSALTIHQRVHTGDKPFSCDICSKAFRFTSGLRLHKRIHSDVKEHHCEVCGKGFHQAIQLQVHLRTHTGEKPFMCATCGKTFGDASSLKGHSAKHGPRTEMPCPMCGKILAKRSLQTHIKMVHIANREFQCSKCPQRFVSRSILAGHMRIHDGTKPFKCKVCEKCFNQHGTLYNHMRSHTGLKKPPKKQNKDLPAGIVQ